MLEPQKLPDLAGYRFPAVEAIERRRDNERWLMNAQRPQSEIDAEAEFRGGNLPDWPAWSALMRGEPIS